jgi:hypothetical protein
MNIDRYHAILYNSLFISIPFGLISLIILSDINYDCKFIDLVEEYYFIYGLFNIISSGIQLILLGINYVKQDVICNCILIIDIIFLTHIFTIIIIGFIGFIYYIIGLVLLLKTNADCLPNHEIYVILGMIFWFIQSIGCWSIICVKTHSDSSDISP